MSKVARRALRSIVTSVAIALIAAIKLPSHAQTPACPEMVRQALQNTGQNCVAVGRDQLCYGADHVDISLRTDAAPGSASFQAPGDVVDMSVVDTIRPAALDAASGAWGVAYLRTRADLADVAAGQFVTIMLFGDVELQQAAAGAPDGVQAYYFRTGIGGADDAACQNTPSNGILIQTQKGAGQIQLVVNGVRLSIGSTVFLQTTPTDLSRAPAQDVRTNGQRPALRVQTFEGFAVVESDGETRLVIAGTELDVPLDEDFVADGPPGEPEAIDEEILFGLDTFLEDASEGDLFEDREPVFDEEAFAAAGWDLFSDFGLSDPGVGDSNEGDAGVGDPGADDPGEGDPGAGDPGAGDPGEGAPPDGG